MKLSVKNIPWILVFLSVSALIHAAVIGGLSGIGGFGFERLIGGRDLTAVLIVDKSADPLSPLKNRAGSLTETKTGESAAESGGGDNPAQQVRAVESVESASKSGPEPESGGQSQSSPDKKDESLLPLKEPETAEPPKPAETAKAEASDNAATSRESLSFDIYWFGVYVGRAKLEAVTSSGNIKITSQVHSAPVISALYKVEDYAESNIVNGRVKGFRIKQSEGRYKSDKETIFDPEGKKVTFFNYLKGSKDEHATETPLLWDVISGFYYLRTQELSEGKTCYINIFDSNKFLKARVDVIKREKLELPGIGTVDTVMVKPVITTDGLFQKKGDIFIWLTDDEKKIPVKVETQVSIGSVVAHLKSIERDGKE